MTNWRNEPQQVVKLRREPPRVAVTVHGDVLHPHQDPKAGSSTDPDVITAAARHAFLTYSSGSATSVAGSAVRTARTGGHTAPGRRSLDRTSRYGPGEARVKNTLTRRITRVYGHHAYRLAYSARMSADV